MTLLTSKQRQFWNDQSYLVLPSLFAAEHEKLSEWVDEVAAWPDDATKCIRAFEREKPSQLSRIENFVPYHQGLAEVLAGKRVIDIVSELMGEPAILYKDRINLKYPGGGPHSAHQDGVAYDQHGTGEFTTDSPAYLSIKISVDGATQDNGCFELVPNWSLDRLEKLPMEAHDAEQPQFTKIKQSVENELEWLPICTEPGDAIIFTERLPHRSKANMSDQRRRILYGVYNPLSTGDRRESYFREKRKDPNNSRYMVGNPHAPTPPALD